jgi:hypothetical protein
MSINIDRQDIIAVSLYPRNTAFDSGKFASAAAVFENMHTGSNVFMIKLKKGKYSFHNIYYKSNLNIFTMEECQFEIKPGVINYLGSLDIQIDAMGIPFYVYTNNDDAVLAFAQQKYPGLFGMYEINPCELPVMKDYIKTKRYW